MVQKRQNLCGKDFYTGKGGEGGCTAYTVGVEYRVSSQKQDYGNLLALFPVPPSPPKLSVTCNTEKREKAWNNLSRELRRG